jgi:hypothetical protein
MRAEEAATGPHSHTHLAHDCLALVGVKLQATAQPNLLGNDPSAV